MEGLISASTFGAATIAARALKKLRRFINSVQGLNALRISIASDGNRSLENQAASDTPDFTMGSAAVFPILTRAHLSPVSAPLLTFGARPAEDFRLAVMG